MGNVIPFPSNEARRLGETGGIIRDLLQKVGVSREIGNSMLANMSEFLEILKFEHSITVEDERDREQILNLQRLLQERNHKLLFDRLIVKKGRCLLLGLS